MNKRPDGEASPLRVLFNRIGLAKQFANRFTVFAALVMAALAIIPTAALAQSNAEGAIFGRVLNGSAAEVEGGKVTVLNKDINFTRTATVSSAGTFEVPSLPVGNYEVTLALKGREPIVVNSYVSIATTTTVRFDLAAKSDTVQLEKVVVSGEKSSPVDVATTVIGLNIRSETIKQLPVARNMTAVSLLTPGVTLGDTGFFGNLSSFAGASVGENAYYLNGFNITDFRRGLGFNTVPFEFFAEWQTLTSGYSAEFGRSTGGVVNAVSKRGTNNYHASLSVYWQPASLTEKAPDTFGTDAKAWVINSVGETSARQVTFDFSGPIIKDHLFFYGLYQNNHTYEDYIAPTTQSSRQGISITQRNHRYNNTPYWAGKVDWQITADHQFEVTAFSDRRDQRTEQYAYPWTSANYMITFPTSLGTQSNQYRALGGRGTIYRYSGNFFSNKLTLSALYGKGTKYDTISTDVSAQEYIVDNRSGSATRLSGSPSETENLDRRNAKRVDGVFRFEAFGSHALKFGYDNENNKAHSLVRTSGSGNAYSYEPYVTGQGALANGATPPAGTTQLAIISYYAAGGDFRVITEATYLEDQWKLFNDRLTLNLGIRNETFDNRNGNDVTFIKQKNQRAPRLSASYDVMGDGLSKVFASWGRYYLQIPANTNVRMAGGELYYTDYYVLNSLKPDNLPNLGAQVGNRTITSNGIVPGVETIVNADIGPMYQDEWTIGYERAINKKWKASIRFIARDLKQVLEDEAVDAALLKYAAAKGYSSFDAGGFDYYVLTNPGKPITFYVNMKNDLNGDGVVDISDQTDTSKKEKVTLDSAALGYPAATRKYYAVQLELERTFADKWFANFSYVWAHSYGNYEGSVYSDIGQTDAGITQLFDQPGLVDGTYGNLPNDRRHTFKAFGGYKLTKEWEVAANFSYQSGRPKNGLGLHPTDVFARVYGGSSYYVNGVLSPRGSWGRTPWVATLDLAIRYKPTWGKNKLTFGADIFNVPNWQTQTAIFERSVAGSSGAKLNFFQKTRTTQTPRFVRLSASYEY